MASDVTDSGTDNLISRVATYTFDRDLSGETWKKGLVIDGLLATGDDQLVDAARRLVDRSIETQTSEGSLSFGAKDPPDGDYGPSWRYGSAKTHPTVIAPPAIGRGVLEFYRRTDDERYLEAAHRQFRHLQTIERTDDGAMYQDQGTTKVNVDTLYMVCPFLATYAAITGDQSALADAVTQLDEQTKYLGDPSTGLYRHAWNATPNAYSQSTFWGRGNGWVLGALIETIRRMPEGHSARDRQIERFHRLCDALLSLQDHSGFWRNVLDDPTAALESSVTLLVAIGFFRGIDLGILPEDNYHTAAERGLDAVTGVVADNGAVQRVALAPGGPGAPIGTGIHGQGLYLLAASIGRSLNS